MFLAANPYFQRRFSHHDNLLRNFQSAIMSVSTVGNLGSMLVLTKLQARANYPRRIAASLILNIAVFTLLALSTKLFLGVSAGVYFAFLMTMVLSASLAAGLCQNGVFAYVAGFGREEYTQGIMVGQGIAGVLPCIAQIVSVLSVPPHKEKERGADSPQQSSTSAFAYFLTATLISALALLAFTYLQRIHSSSIKLDSSTPSLPASRERKSIPLTHLFKKLTWLATAIFLTFVVTMFFPVFTQSILSTHVPSSARLFQPPSFIPLAFLFWNTGDLLGRTLPAIPSLRLTAYPKLLFVLSIARAAFVPLYLLCNIGGKGAVVSSDFFYLVVVQFCFGISNGYLGSSCMMGFAEYVSEEEAEAAGGFMSLCLVGGLTAGSLLSFFAAQAISI